MGSHSDLAGLAEPRHDSRIGVLLADRYRIHALVDRGAMGQVYVGEHVLMKKRVAVKVLHRELTTVPEFVSRFEREAMAAANIDNEHVVAATDFGKLPDGAVFLVLEYIEGKNLRDEVVLGPLPVVRTLHIVRQIAYALRSAHALGIVHRDLKPENVMLVEKEGDPDFVKVLDFGIAKVPMGDIGVAEGPSSRPITKAGMVYGTPEYMPPEQALGQIVDARADLYSLGVMAFEMLAGCRPFMAGTQVSILGQQIAEGAPRISRRAPGVTVPRSVERFVRRLLEREASARFQSADEVLEAIDKQLGYAPSSERVPTRLQGTAFQIAETDPAPSDFPPSDFPPSDDDQLPTTRMSIPGESHPLQGIARFLEAFQSRLPAPLRAVPAPVIFSAPLALIGILAGFGIVSAMSPAHSAEPASSIPSSGVKETASAAPSSPPAPRSATSADIARASNDGVAALAKLGESYPKDPAIPLAESAALLKRRDTLGAVKAIQAALGLDEALKDNAQIASALWVAAQNKKSAPLAFELLKGPMRDRGASILHDLTTTAGVRDDVRADARRALGEIQPGK